MNNIPPYVLLCVPVMLVCCLRISRQRVSSNSERCILMSKAKRNYTILKQKYENERELEDDGSVGRHVNNVKH